MRIALKIAYIGTDYHGFQVQPDVMTIEGELIKALQELNIINNRHEANYGAAGRTDRGVHALGQVIAFDTEKPEAAIPRAVNSKLPGTIRVWARVKVPDFFDPRRDARSREYRYIMTGNYDVSLIRDACRIFAGMHDFSNFATPDKERTTVCKIEKIDARIERDFTIIDIKADFFLWHMVRKIATAMKMIGSGTRDISWLEAMLDPQKFTEALEPAPAYGLFLKNVEYKDIRWEEDPYALKLISNDLDDRIRVHSIMAELLRELKQDMIEDHAAGF